MATASPLTGDHSIQTPDSMPRPGGGTEVEEVITEIEDSCAVPPPCGPMHHLTVNDDAPKLDVDELEKQENRRPGTSWAVIVIKWVSMLVMLVLFLYSLVVSKLAIIHLATHLHELQVNGTHDRRASNTSGAAAGPVYGIEGVFLTIVITITLPAAVTMLRSAWTGLFHGDRAWPSLWALCWGILASALESCGISMIAVSILPQMTSLSSISLMNGVFLCPIIIQIIVNIRYRRSRRIILMMAAALVMEIIGLVFIVMCVHETGKVSEDRQYITMRTSWRLFLAVASLSLAWTPWVQRQQLYPTAAKFRKMYKERRVTNNWPGKEDILPAEVTDAGDYSSLRTTTSSAANTSTTTSSNGRGGSTSSEPRSLISLPESVDEDAWIDKYIDLIFREPQLSARWKNSFVCAVARVIFTPGFAMLWGYAFHVYDPASLQAGILNVNVHSPVFEPFMFSVFASFVGYVAGCLACSMAIQILSFALPLVLSTPLTILVLMVSPFCEKFFSDADFECGAGPTVPIIIYSSVGALCLYVAQLLSTSYFIFTTQTAVMEKEAKLFWLPNYSSAMLEQSMLLNRKNIQTDMSIEDPRDRVKRSRVFICTTMYRENETEMEQLLESINRINIAMQTSGRKFCHHVFLDNGVTGMAPTKFALQLVYVAKRVFNIEGRNCTKMETPYGMNLAWQLNSEARNEHGTPTEGMEFVIHLKDISKVKNKKRWSQVMYMSYFLDYYMKQVNAQDSESFILTTDADVKFYPESAEALLDLLSRDPRVGGVCARTFPMGSGPLYWYQIFEYAVGHWLQKVANHVLGSVLCCPGCFSAFRVAALRDVLPKFATHVDEASDFLTKDMGEDRWLCTLMIQCGWRMEYCAVSTCYTYCPVDLNEYANQKRRWILSTLANLWLLLKQWKIVSRFNRNMTTFFQIYQAILLLGTLLAPSLCIFVIVGSLQEALGMEQWWTATLAILVTVGYALVCMYCKQETQLKVGKILTIFSAFVMAAVVVGWMTKIANELQVEPPTPNITTPAPTPPRPQTTAASNLQAADPGIISMLEAYRTNDEQNDGGLQYSDRFRVDPPPTTKKPPPVPGLPRRLSITSIYLFALIGIFVLAALVHPTEAYSLVHGIWYLFFFPATMIFLLIYSVWNMTDRSWGTREEKKKDVVDASVPWQEKALHTWKAIFFCCAPKPDRKRERTADDTESNVTGEEEGDNRAGHSTRPRRPAARLLSGARRVERSTSFRFHPEVCDIKSWLPSNLQNYSKEFVAQGYEDTSFIAGMSENELENFIGVKNLAHRHAIMREIKKLPLFELEPSVPENTNEWLILIGLSSYNQSFRNCHIVTRQDMEVLKQYDQTRIEEELKITKRGHLKRLLMAIETLRYPTKAEKEIAQAKYEIGALRLAKMSVVKSDEQVFWEELKEACLRPDSGVFAQDLDLKNKLVDLRTAWIMMFAITNAVFLIMLQTMADKLELTLYGSNIVGLIFLILFSFVLLVQFCCMLFHRMSTWAHLVGRAPFRRGKPTAHTWAFDDRSLVLSGELEARIRRERIDEISKQKFQKRYERLRQQHDVNADPQEEPDVTSDPTTPLLASSSTQRSRPTYSAIPT